MLSTMKPSLARTARLAAPKSRLLHNSPHPSISTSVLRITTRLRPVCANMRPIAAFHSSSRHNILPPLPQRLSGTANEAAPIPTPSPAHGNYHWDFERLVSVALIPVTVAPFAAGSLHPVMDATLCGLIIIHSHIGFTSCIVDYFPKQRVPKTRTALEWILRLSTLGVAIGLYEFETNDVGVTEAISRIWKAKA